MSILKPKDGDYIVRSIFLLVGWCCIGWVPFAFVGGILAGAGGATLGFAVAYFSAPFVYWAYLKLDLIYSQNLRESRRIGD